MSKHLIQYENECMVLGCILKDSTLVDELTLGVEHYTDSKNRALHNSIKKLYDEGKPISFVSLARLPESERNLFGGTSHLADCQNSVISIDSFVTYQQEIKEYHTVGQAQDLAKSFLNATEQRNEITELSDFITKIGVLETSTVKDKGTFKSLLADRYSYHINTPTKGLSGANTGFMGLNKFTDGWQASDLIIVAGRPSMGKTAFVLNSLMNGCKKDDVFGTFYSIEMSKGLIIDRLIAMESGINLQKMRNPNKTFTDEEWKIYNNALGRLEKLNLDIRDEYTVPTIRASLKRNIKEHPDMKHVAVIDFLTLIKHHNASGNTHKDISDIVRDLKQVCKDLNVPIIVLSQLNRGVEARQDKRPNMGDLAESGTIEQIADLISFLYRDEYYNPETPNPGITDLIIAKNRNGATGVVNLRFKKQSNTFSDVT